MPKYRGYITTLPKADWKSVLPEIEQHCENYLGGQTKSYKLSFEEAFSSDEVITLYYVPSRRASALTLAEVKQELKLAGVRIVTTEQDAYKGVKYYTLFIPKQYKRKVDAVLDDIADTTNVSYKLIV